MLIVSADDWGRNTAATDTTLACFEHGRIHSTGAMVFMADSKRGATLARACGVDTGLHVNFSEEFSAPDVPADIRRAHDRIRSFLRRNKYALLVYNPLLKADFALVFKAQLEEFRKLFGRDPSHIDGHQHMHLCTNMLLQNLLPEGAIVRRSFSFRPGQKSVVNRAYRSLVDRRLARRHRLTDYFFAISLNLSIEKLQPIFDLAQEKTVELMVHPEVKREYDFLMTPAFAAAISSVRRGNYLWN